MTTDEALLYVYAKGFRVYSIFGPTHMNKRWLAHVVPYNYNIDGTGRNSDYRPGYGNTLAEALVASTDYVKKEYEARPPVARVNLDDVL